MMKIIQFEPFANGARPALQTWNGEQPPKGYAWCLDEFCDVFYSTNPAGFVDIEIENDTVVAMVVNQTALDAYVAEHPATEPETDGGDSISVADMANAIRKGVNAV